MKNLFNNISQEEKNRILEMHSGKKRVISENINFINEQASTKSLLAKEFSLMAGAGERALKTEIERLLLTTELKTTSGIALKTADEVLNAFLAGKLTTNDVKVVTKDIINNSKNTQLRLNYIQKLVSSQKYQDLMGELSRVEALAKLKDMGYKNAEEIVHEYEQLGNTFQKYSKNELETIQLNKVKASQNAAQLVKEIDDLETFITDFKNLKGKEVVMAPGMPARVQEAKKILRKIKSNPASIPQVSQTQLESIENAIRTAEPSLWNYIGKYLGKYFPKSKPGRTLAIITIGFAIGGAFWGKITAFFKRFLENKFKSFIDDFITGYNGSSSTSTPTPDKNLSNYIITVGDDGKPVYTLKK